MSKQVLDICKECGVCKAEHHEFVPVTLPRGCTCDYRDWGCEPDEIPTVCGEYRDTDYGVCGFCDHLEECHE